MTTIGAHPRTVLVALLAAAAPCAAPAAEPNPADPLIKVVRKALAPCRGVTEVSRRIEGENALKPTLSLNCGLSPLPKLWVSAGLKAYPDEDQKRPWDPDFSVYAGYDLGRGFRLEYADWTGNRFDAFEAADLVDGRVTLAYRLPLKTLVADAPDALSSLDCSVGVGTDPLPRRGERQVRASATCGSVPLARLRLRGAVLMYPEGDQRPWDPDFTYSATWQVTDRVSIGYANYAANQWFWRDDDGGGGAGWEDGAVTIAYSAPLRF